MYQNQILDRAEEILAEGVNTQAMKEDVKERADFYLNYAIVKRDTDDYRGSITMFATATDLYARYYGRESSQLMYANDLLAVTVAAVGHIASAMNIEQRNLEIAERVLGPDDPFTWKVQNNLADMLREIGAPSRALGYDLNVLSRAHRLLRRQPFQRPGQRQQHGPGLSGPWRLPIGAALFPAEPGHRRRAQAGRQSGRAGRRLDALHAAAGRHAAARRPDHRADRTIGRRRCNYPEILCIKIAYLLADHFAASDAERSMKLLEQAYEIAGTKFDLRHPLTFAAQLAIAVAKAKTDSAAAAADFASLDHDMIEWNSAQIGTRQQPRRGRGDASAGRRDALRLCPVRA